MPPPPPRPPGAASAVRSWTLRAPEGTVDVEVAAPDDGTLADVLGAVAGALGVPVVRLWAGSVELPAHTPLAVPELRNGAVLGLARPGPRDTGGGSSGALELHVTGGPDAGRTVPLTQGDVVLGRSTGAGVQVADPDVSRRHAVVSVAGGRVTVADPGSANGSALTGPAGPPAALGPGADDWPVGAVLRVGSTSLRLTGPRGASLEQTAAAGGRHLVRPLPGTPRAPRPVAVRFPAEPAEPGRRRLGWAAVALPAVGGVLMAWLLATPLFLFFALLSPLVAVAGWSSDRVTGRRAHRRAVADHDLARALADAELADAVAADQAQRDEDHPDLARLAAAARRRCSPLWSRAATDPAGLTLRLGTGPGPTGVTRVEADGTRTAATADAVPVCVPLGGGGLGIVGPRSPALGVVRALVCQLAVLASPAEVDLVLVCPPERTASWAWLRWLPHLRAVVQTGTAAPAELLAPGPATRTVVVLDGPVDGAIAEALVRERDRLLRLDVAGSEAGLALPAPARVELTGETGTTARLRVPGADDDRLLTVDAVSAGTAAGIARDLAGLAVPRSSGDPPDAAHLLDLPTAGLRLTPDGEAVGGWDRSRRRLVAALGADARGPVVVDLVADGPHALVAGTTGSGKSELLQTLVAGLALHHPPDRCSFLLVDYKGGAAFGEAAALPHTVGVLTDLDSQSTARALRSLSAELTRRERLLAEHGARDLAALPEAVHASRLVIVVDEFATLAEELPGFVSGLVGIAQRGRSLGVHLVLATQRPAGVVSPEIRANCSLRVCLRTTDEGDSRDVLGDTASARLSPDRPGRAYLRVGSAVPVLLQVARVSGTAAAGTPVVTARRHIWPEGAPLPAAPPGPARATDLQRLAAALDRRARTAGARAVDRPWLPPLPDLLPAGSLDDQVPGHLPTRLPIGLVDRPDAQAQVPLELDLADGGGWLVVGGPGSGRTTALRTVLTQAVGRLPPSRLDVHVLDHGGGALAREAAAVPHCGTTVGRADAHRCVRLVHRLAEEVERRRQEGPVDDRPLLLVLVDGYESLVGQLEEADPATGGADLLRLVRDGGAVGVTVVLTAERALPGSRVAAAVRTRLVLPLPDRADYAVAGVLPRSVPGHRPPGRALVGEDAAECQLALPARPVRPLPDPPRATTGAAVGPPPLRVVALPADPLLPLTGRAPEAGARSLWLPLGPGGDDGHVVGVDLGRIGGLLVVGPAGSGRSSALAAFARHCAHAGAVVLRLGDGPGRLPAGSTASPDDGPAELDHRDVEALRAELARDRGGRLVVVVADDLTTLADAAADALATVPGTGAPALVLASGTAADLAAAFRGPAVALRRSRTALLLRPVPGDAELLGLRTPRTPLPARPGSGWLVTAGDSVRVQVARHRQDGPG
ncbi:FtsK/SpoIIIE domain-containing protein [Modestobacter versicolor]|uniref:FtsK/SpoIIIE domain-containing protein n=1 Tax=Modestobacter versicolor TaxID=429133 RepID=UPI0034DF8C95